MLDCRSATPLIGDVYAERFMGAEGPPLFEPFRHLAVPNGTNLARCHLIDEELRARLAAAPQTRVVQVGAGFDSRPFRLRGGRWVEIDECAVIDRKEAIAPAASCPNPLTRVAIDFAREKLADKLAAFATQDEVVAVCEGVSMYITPTQTDELIAALVTAFPRHVLLVDIMSRRFLARFGRSMTDALATMGAAIADLEDDPLLRFTRTGYRPISIVSLVERSVAMGRVPTRPRSRR